MDTKKLTNSYLLRPVVPCLEALTAHQQSPSKPNLSNPLQLLFILFMSASNPQHSVFFGLPLFRFPSGFQVTACLVMHFDDFRNVCPVQFQRLFPISFSAS